MTTQKPQWGKWEILGGVRSKIFGIKDMAYRNKRQKEMYCKNVLILDKKKECKYVAV